MPNTTLISNRICFALLTVGLATQVGLLWVPEYLPFIDWPNHLARHELEARWLSGRPLPQDYRIEYRLLPNLGGDVVVPPLLLMFDLATASRLAWGLAVILTTVGPLPYVSQIAGRSTALTVGLLWLPWVITGQMCWGFYNYYSGIGLSFLALAHLETVLRRPKPPILGLVLHSCLATGLFFWHLSDWGIYGLLFAVRVMFEVWRTGFFRFVVVSLTTIPSLTLCTAYFVANRNSGGDLPGTAYVWGGLSRKLQLLLGPFRGYDLGTDVLALAVWGLALSWVVLTPRAPVSTRRRWLTPALGTLLVAYFALPFQLGTTSDTDSRVVPAVLLLSLTALLWGRPIRSRWVLVLVVLCVTLRIGTIGWNWWRLSARLQQEALTLVSIPPGSRVLPVVLMPHGSRKYPEAHFLNYGVISRDLRVPDLFALSDQHTLQYPRPRPKAWEKRSGTVHFDQQALRDNYDYVWVYNPESAPVELPSVLEQVSEVADVHLYRVR